MVNRLFVTKLEALDVEGGSLHRQIKEFLQIDEVSSVKVYNGYDVEGLNESELEKAIECVFSEPNADTVSRHLSVKEGETVIVYKLLPGQYDQRADSAKQCLAILGLGESVGLQSFKAVVLSGNLSKSVVDRIKSYLINPVEAIEIPLEAPSSTGVVLPKPESVLRFEGFLELDETALTAFIKEQGLAMNLSDLLAVQAYFKSENRVPSHTEIKVLDTYWSDHCRHTTFTTELTERVFKDSESSDYAKLLLEAEGAYHEMRQVVYGEKAKTRPVTLMDLATINAKYLKKQGKLTDVLESEEINAATFEVEVTLDNGNKEPYWVLFKNETHNHPTEIEPFGGAATCLGGAIRDPLSGRALVYQGMRITGSADPRASLEDTLSGKLAQRIITRGAARGFSSYGNQIGLSTGFVREYYHEGFLAKRMEVGAVVGAVPRDQVRRETPIEGDVILLIGGRTGIDGCGGATGSSKEHDEASLATCASEVQRGNAPEERKLQRLFSSEAFASLVKKSNDFGAGGVSVAVGELADSLKIDLDAVRTKYEGLSGTELAISESQERMAVVVSKEDVARVIALSEAENLEAYPVAEVTADGYLIMCWQGEEILKIKRDFIETNGAKRSQAVLIDTAEPSGLLKEVLVAEGEKVPSEKLSSLAKDLNYCSQEGLVEMFDNSIGALSVQMPFGGSYQKTPTQAMISKIAGYGKNVNTATVMAAGYDPYTLSADPFVGGLLSTVEALAKVVSVGGNVEKTKFSMQEYFEKLGDDGEKWSKPYKALLGSALALKALELCAIGGKDSMSGTFKDISVPPTLIAFAATVTEAERAVSPEFKTAGESLLLLDFDRDQYGVPDLGALRPSYEAFENLVKEGLVQSAMAVEEGGVLGALTKMTFGNRIGFKGLNGTENKLFDTKRLTGALVFSVKSEGVEGVLEAFKGLCRVSVMGQTTATFTIETEKATVDLLAVLKDWESPLAEVFPRALPCTFSEPSPKGSNASKDLGILRTANPNVYDLTKASSIQLLSGAKPKVFIPAFPGTNCEMDTKRAFEEAGAEAEVIIFKNKTAQDVKDSLLAYTKAASQAQMIALPGGFSAGDEPDGSGKFICSAFRNPELAEAVMKMLRERDGLMIGICNGFQALVKLGLVTYGEIRTLEADAPTLTYNTCGKHISKIVSIDAVENNSPWLKNVAVGESYQVPLSHGEGRFVCTDEWYERLKSNGQLATHYQAGSNLNGSMFDIEGITSPDGRVLGKMGHAERIGQFVYKNVPGRYDMEIFKAGVSYFK